MSNYRADCSRCCGLCCIVPAQLAVQGFPADKPAETPCVHLDESNRCSIHATRRHHGYQACEIFECFGAGQWLTQRLFGGAKWTDSPDKARQMFAAFRYWAPRFETAALIEAALPYVRDDAFGPLSAMMADLTSTDISQTSCSAEAGQLRRETLRVIRSALRVDDEIL